MEKMLGSPELAYLDTLPDFPKKHAFGSLNKATIESRMVDLNLYIAGLQQISGTSDELRLFLGVFGHHSVDEYETALRDPASAMDPTLKPKKPERIKVRLDMGTGGLGARIMIEEGVPGLKIMDIKP